MIFHLFHRVVYPDFMEPLRDVMPYTAFLMAAFSALRLAKFNIDTRQTSSFIGVPTPANTLFWVSLIVGNYGFWFQKSSMLSSFSCSCCYPVSFLVAEIPMFALKFKNLSWQDNKIKFIFILTCIPMIIFLGVQLFCSHHRMVCHSFRPDFATENTLILAWFLFISPATKHKKLYL